MSLQDLEARLLHHRSGEDLNLTKTSTGLEDFEPFLDASLGAKSILLAGVAIERTEKAVTVSGKATLLRIESVQVRAVFTWEEQKFLLGLTAELPPSLTLDVPGFSIGHVGFTLDGRVPASPTGILHGGMRVFDRTDIKLELALPVTEYGWFFAASVEGIPVPSLEELARLAGGEQLTRFLPPGMGSVEGLALSQLGILFNPAQGTVDMACLEIRAEKFDIYPEKLALKKMAFALQIDYPLDNSQRAVSGQIQSVLAIGNVSIPVMVAREGGTGDWLVRITSIDGCDLPKFADLIALIGGEDLVRSLPKELAGIGNINLERFEVEFNPSKRSISFFSITIHCPWEIISGQLSLDPGELKLDVENPLESRRKIGGLVAGCITIAETQVLLSAVLEDQLVLKGAIPELDLTGMAREILGGAPLPDFLPEIKFLDVAVSITPVTGAFAAKGSAEATWTIDGKDLKITASLDVQRSNVPKGADDQSADSIECALGIKMETEAEVTDGLTLQQLDLGFHWSKGEKWSVSGTAGAKVLGHALTLGSTYEGGNNTHKLRLFQKWGEDKKTLVSIGGLAVLKASELNLDIEKKNNKTNFELEVKSGLSLVDVIEANGTLKLYRRDNEIGMEVELDESSWIDLPLVPQPLMSPPITLKVTAPKIAIARGRTGWSLECGSTLALTGLPEYVYENMLLPRSITTNLKIDSESISVTADKVTEPFQFTLPDITIEGTTISFSHLGAARIDLTDLSLKIKKQSSLEVTLGIGLPEKLNHVLFGANDDGTPAVNLFRTFDPNNVEESRIKVTFGLGYISSEKPVGIIFRLDSSPINAITVERGEWKCDLGAFGAIDIKIPTFNYDGKSFSATAGYKIREDRELKIPLTPIKEMLTRSGAAAVAKCLPDALPLLEFKLFEDNKLKVEELIKTLNDILKAIGWDPLPKEIADPLREIGKVADRLPNTLKDYLNIEIPRSSSMEIAIKADGGINIDVKVDPDRPLKLLYPNMVAGIPVLQGVRFNGFSFGTVMGGTLFSTKIDAVFDQFDLLTLLGTLVIPPNDLLPKSTDVQRRLIVKNFYMLILFVKIPIPIPIFYDQLGIEVLGLEGVHLQAHVKFPMPTFDFRKLVQIVAALKRFITEKDYALPVQTELDLDLLQITAGSPEHVWAVNAAKQVLRHTGDAADPWKAVGEIAEVKDVSVGGDGAAWAVAGGEGRAYRLEGETWKEDRGSGLIDISVGSKDQVAGVNTQGHMYRYNEQSKTWEAIAAGLPAGQKAVGISIGSDGTVCVVADGEGDLKGRVYRLEGSAWTWDVDPRFEQLSVGARTQLAGVNRDARMFRVEDSRWVGVPSLPGAEKAAGVAVDAQGSLLAVSKEKRAWRLEGGAWKPFGRKEGLTRKMDLKFTLEDVYIQLPKYFGSVLLGKKGLLAKVSLLQTIATLLNAIKFFSLKETIQLIDLKHRVGNETVTFFFLTVQAQWLLTTPKEFREGAYERLGAKPDQIEQYLDVLPRTGDEEGAVAFLQGDWKIQNGELASLHTAFGLIASGGRGFATGMKIEGFVKNVVHVKLEGAVCLIVDGPNFKFQLKGAGHLSFANREIFDTEGLIEIEPNRFLLHGRFDLFKDLPFLVRSTGLIDAVIDEQGVFLDAKVSSSIGPIVLTDANVMVRYRQSDTPKGVWIYARFLGAKADFEFVDRRDHLSLHFVADMRPLAEVKADAKMVLGPGTPTMRTDATVTILNFGTLTLDSSSVGRDAKIRIRHLGLTILDGSSTSAPDKLSLTGDFHLLPAASPLNVTGILNGEFRKDVFSLNGNVKTTLLPEAVLSSADAVITEKGVTVALGLLGQPVAKIKVVKENFENAEHLVLRLGLSLGPLRLEEAGLYINLAGTGGTGRLRGGVGDLRLDARFSLGMQASGRHSISLFGHTLLSGDIQISGNRFSLSGKLNLLLLQLALTGSVSQQGLHLHGKTEFGLPNLPKFGLEMTINNGPPAVRMWDPAKWLTFQAGMGMFRGQMCFCALWWPVGVNHLVIGPRGIVLIHWQLRGVHDEWPAHLRPKSGLDGGLMEDLEGIDKRPLLEIVREYLFHDWVQMPEQPPFDVERYKSTQRTLLGYEADLEVLRDEEGLDDAYEIQMTLRRSSWERDFFTDIQGRLSAILMKDGDLEAEEVQRLVNMDGAKAVFRTTTKDAPSGKATMSLELEGGGPDSGRAVPFDFDHPEGADLEIAKALLG